MKSAFFLVFLLPVFSFASTWVTNPDHSEIIFQVPYMGVSEVTGSFSELSGRVELDKQGPKGPLVVEISSASVYTGNKMRDNHLQSNDFFQSKIHPKITFKSKEIVRAGEKTYKAFGDLTIRGITKPATVEFSLSDKMEDTWGFDNRFVKFRSTVNRKDYDITWNKTLDGKQFLVGEEVTFWGNFQLQPASSKTPNSKHMIPDTEYIRERDTQRREKSEEESALFQKLKNFVNGK